jgi:hypothetical protein
MVNGPMGGNMGTPPVAPQPPQVSFTTTAESRGGFNNFLKSIPATTNMIPPTPPMGSPQMPMANPMGNPMGNIDIFNQPPSMGMGMMGMNQPQMNPMMQPPMQQPMNMGMMQQPMMMANGGGVPPRRTEIMGQDHMLSYITPEEGGILKALGGAGRPGPMGIPSFYEYGGEEEGTSDSDVSDAQEASGGYGDDNNESNDNEPFDDGGGRPEDYGLTQQDFTDASNVGESTFNESQDNRTNIVNVGPTSNLTYDPQFTADNLASRGLDPQGFMSGDNFGQTTQGMQAANQAQRDAELSQANILSGRSMPTMGDLGASQNIAGAIAPANIASGNISSVYSPFSDLDDRNGLGFSALDDPLGLGINTGYGPAADAARNREALTGAFGTPNYRQEAGLPTVSDASFSQTPNILGVEDALIGAIKDGRSDLYAPFTNNPGNLKQAREDLTTESIKSVDPVTGEIKTGPAFFNTLDAGQKALDDQLGRYGDRGINNPQDFVNTYLGTDVRENPLANKQGYITAVNNAVGSNFDLSDANVRNNLSNAITRQELGQKGINALNNQVTAATGLDLSSLAQNAPITSAPTVASDPMATDRSPGRMSAVFGPEMASLAGGLTPNEIMREVNITDPSQSGQFPSYQDPALSRDQQIAQDVSNITAYNNYTDPNVNSGNIPSDMSFSEFMNATTPGTTEYNNTRGFTDKDLAPNTTDIFSPSASDFANFQATRNQLAPEVASSMNRGRSGGGGQNIAPQNSIQNALNRATRGTRGIELGDFPQTIGPETSSGFSAIGSGRTGQTPTTDTVYDIDTRPENQAGFRDTPFQFDPANYIEGLGMVEAGGKGISALTPAQKSQQVDSSPPPADYEENVGKPYSGLDVGKVEDFYNAPTTFDRLGLPPGMFSTVLNFAENKARDFVAADLISGNFDPIYDRDGKITGSRNPRTGEVQSGMDFNAPDTGSNDNEVEVILKRIAKEKKEEEEEEKDDTPNVFGGGSADPVSSRPLVVDSPFTSNVGDYTPVGYDGGNINDLIARLTGIASPKRAAKGGVIGYANGGGVDQALDRFLASA